MSHSLNISSILGRIKESLTIIQKYQSIDDFEKVQQLVDQNRAVVPYLTISIPDILYDLYKKDSKWFDNLKWSLEKNLPIPHQNASLPFVFRVTKDQNTTILKLLVDNGYDLNERFLLERKCHSNYVSSYNFTDGRASLVELLYQGGWRPCCTNSRLDLPNIILKQQLNVDQISEILDSYFDHEDPNNCLIIDNRFYSSNIDLLNYILYNWNDQDPRIIEQILKDVRWEYDIIHYARIKNLSFDHILQYQLNKHDDRKVLFKGQMYLWNYIATHPNRTESCYQIVLASLVDHFDTETIYHDIKNQTIDKDKYRFDSSQTYDYINSIWIDFISIYLPHNVDKNELYNPHLIKRYCHIVSNYFKEKLLYNLNLSNRYNIHTILRIQINIMSYLYDYTWYPEYHIKQIYQRLFKI